VKHAAQVFHAARAAGGAESRVQQREEVCRASSGGEISVTQSVMTTTHEPHGVENATYFRKAHRRPDAPVRAVKTGKRRSGQGRSQRSHHLETTCATWCSSRSAPARHHVGLAIHTNHVPGQRPQPNKGDRTGAAAAVQAGHAGCNRATKGGLLRAAPEGSAVGSGGVIATHGARVPSGYRSDCGDVPPKVSLPVACMRSCQVDAQI